MYIIMVATECAPVAKVGGLADVVHGLAHELEIRGHAVEIILPLYDSLKLDHVWGMTRTWENLQVPWYGGTIPCTVWFGFVQGRKCFFIEPHSRDRYFSRGRIYGEHDDHLRFAFLCKATLEYMYKTGKRPDVIHAHDWQTALVPVLLYEMYARLGLGRQRVCFTIHNFKHQGLTDAEVLRATGLGRPGYFIHFDRLQDNVNPGLINLMKGGIVYSNFVTTVSPRHAWESLHTHQGQGLELTLQRHARKFTGILNGLDYDVWNPETDPILPHRYTVDDPSGKKNDQEALRQRLWLRDGERPIVAYVGRLDPQKGIHLIERGLFYALERGGQFVLLGNSPQLEIDQYFRNLKHMLNDHPDCHLEIDFSEELAHLIYAGADLMLVPSIFEPCGLTQLISLKYGTIPVVRAVGGLADTIFDYDYSPAPSTQRNGFVFEHADHPGVESALRRALDLWYDSPDDFQRLARNAMLQDYSWNRPGQRYLDVYSKILPA